MVGGGTPSRSDLSYFGGTIPWVTPTDLQRPGIISILSGTAERITKSGLANSSAKLIPAGSVLFSSRASIGKIAITDIECCTNQGFVNFTPDPLKIDSWFLAYLLRHITPDLIKLAGKTTFLEIPRTKLRNHLVKIPKLTEQDRIVERIKECMERVEEIELLRDEAVSEQVALFPSVLNKSFAEVAAKAPTHTLEEVCMIRGGGSLPKGTGKDCGKDCVLLVKVGDMNLPDNERIVTTAREFLPTSSAGNSVIQAGAVIFPKRGGAIATNKKRVLGRPSLIDPNLMAIEARQELVSPGYLYYWSLTLDLRTISNGGVIPQLNRKDLAPLVIPVPDLASQNELVEKFEMLETLCSQIGVEAKIRDFDCSHLRDAILRKAFAGEL